MLGGYGSSGFAGPQPQPIDPTKILAWLQLMQKAPGAIKGIGSGIGSLLGGTPATGMNGLSPLAGMAPAAASGLGSASGMAAGMGGDLAAMAPEAAAGAGSAAGAAAGAAGGGGSIASLLAMLGLA